MIFWEESGNPNGVPAVVLHGGPGSGSSPFHRRFFDLERYRLIQFDQRNCGRSTPHASDPAVSLADNTIGNLLHDIEDVRAAAGVDRWVVLGNSFGSLLGVAYAMTCPERVRALVLVGVAVGRQSELDFIYGGIAARYPDAWARFTDGIAGDVIAAYHRLVNDPDPAVRAEYARRWTEWDWETASVDAPPLSGQWADPDFQLARARICTHYFTGDVLRAGEQLTRPQHVARLQAIDGVMINGEHDLQDGLRELHALWPRADVVIVPAAGHSTGDGGMLAAIRAATDRFAVDE